MTKISTIEIHSFINLDTGKTCKVISRRIEHGRFSVIFRGWNPFPCYSMETNWGPFTEWMSNNGWMELNGIDRIITKREGD